MSPDASSNWTVASIGWTASAPDDLRLRLDRAEALELLVVVQATLNAISRSRELTVGAAILTGVRAKLIDAVEEDT
jgi:hypothetical protein